MPLLHIVALTALAAPVTSPSAHGALLLEQEGETCSVTFRSTTHGAVPLMEMGGCVGNASLAPVQRVGTLLFPATAGKTEFHVLAIPSARGGNACAGDDVFVIALDGANAWASDGFGGCAHLESASTRPDGTLVVEVRAQDGSGQRATVRMGKATFTDLPAPAAKAGRATAAREETLRGTLQSAIHATNFHDYVETDPSTWSAVEITEPGPCKLEPLYGELVEVVVRVKGETRTCVSVKRAPPR